MEDMLTWGKQILASQPFSVLLGAELLAFREGNVELKVPLRADLKQQHGFVHGGLISYAADNALTYAGGSVLGPSVVTSEFKINYVRPALGEFIVARASFSVSCPPRCARARMGKCRARLRRAALAR